MTQKELLYVEDAIMHESNIVSILEDNLNYLEEENLTSFFENEVKSHNKTKESLIKLLEKHCNEWYINIRKLSIST